LLLICFQFKEISNFNSDKITSLMPSLKALEPSNMIKNLLCIQIRFLFQVYLPIDWPLTKPKKNSGLLTLPQNMAVRNSFGWWLLRDQRNSAKIQKKRLIAERKLFLKRDYIFSQVKLFSWDLVPDFLIFQAILMVLHA
jgi:hypothetical protein